VFLHGTVLCSSSVQGSPAHCDGVVHEQFNPHRRETRGDWASCAVRRRFLGQQELRAVNRKASDDVATASQVSKELRPEGRFVEINRSISVTDGQHGRDLCRRAKFRPLASHGTP